MGVELYLKYLKSYNSKFLFATACAPLLQFCVSLFSLLAFVFAFLDHLYLFAFWQLILSELVPVFPFVVQQRQKSLYFVLYRRLYYCHCHVYHRLRQTEQLQIRLQKFQSLKKQEQVHFKILYVKFIFRKRKIYLLNSYLFPLFSLLTLILR